MNGYLLIFLVSCALLHSGTAVQLLPAMAALPDEQSLAKLLFSPRLYAQDPQVSMACFAEYILKSKEVGEVYSKNYNECLLDAADARRLAEEKMLPYRKELEATARDICKRLTDCNEVNSTLDMFTCHANAGTNNTKAVYSIAGNASEYSTFIKEQYHIIDLRHEQCCKAAERTYVESSAKTYNELQACLDGRVKPNPVLPSSSPKPVLIPTIPPMPPKPKPEVPQLKSEAS